MTQAQGSRARISYGVQADFDTEATTWQEIRVVSESLDLTKEYFEDATLSFDRQRTDGRHGTEAVAGDIVVSMRDGIIDDFLAGVMFQDWTSDVLTVGVTPKYFSVEKWFSDIDVADVFTGCMVNTFAMTVNTDGIVQGTFGLVGAGYDTSATEKTVTSDTSKNPFDGFSGTIEIADTGGAYTASAIVTEFSLNIDNGLNATYVIGSKQANSISYDMTNITGSLSVYFEDDTFRARFRDETETAVRLTLTDVLGNDYIFELPRVKINSATTPVGGGADITMSAEFVALKDDVLDTMLKITRPTTV